MHRQRLGMTRGRLTMLAAVLVLPFGALGVRNRMLSTVPAASDSTQGLLARLEVDSEDALEAQGELERRAGKSDIQLWLKVLEKQGPFARYLAADAIAKTKLPEGGPVLASLMTDYASHVRTCAVESLGAGKYKEAVPTLVAALADEDTWVRESAVGQLGIRREPATVPALLAAIHDSDRATASQATAVLQKITGKPFRASFVASKQDFARAIGKWEEWWKAARPSWPVDRALEKVRPIMPSRVGPAAADFTVETVGGRNDAFRFSDKRGKVVFITFFGVQCGPCIIESEDIERVYKEFAAQGLEVLGLDIESEKPESLTTFAKWRQVTYPMAPAPFRTVLDYGHIHDVPVTYLIDRKGRIRYQWNGQRDYETFAPAVKRLLAER